MCLYTTYRCSFSIAWVNFSSSLINTTFFCYFKKIIERRIGLLVIGIAAKLILMSLTLLAAKQTKVDSLNSKTPHSPVAEVSTPNRTKWWLMSECKQVALCPGHGYHGYMVLGVGVWKASASGRCLLDRFMLLPKGLSISPLPAERDGVHCGWIRCVGVSSCLGRAAFVFI